MSALLAAGEWMGLSNAFAQSSSKSINGHSDDGHPLGNSIVEEFECFRYWAWLPANGRLLWREV